MHIFKTAGTTLTGILRRNFAARHLDTRIIQEKPALTGAQLKRAMVLYPRLESIAGHAVRTHSDLKSAVPKLRFYTLLREPRARVVSAFRFVSTYRMQQGLWNPQSDADIRAALLKMAARHQTYRQTFAPAGGGVAAAIEAIETHVEFVGLVERFEESLALLRNWIGRDFDPRYRRLNTREQPSYRPGPASDGLRRVQQVTNEALESPDISDQLAESQRDEIAVYDHVRTKTFERMRERYNAGPGPFSFETPDVAVDTVVGHAHRALIGRPLAPLIARATREPKPS